MDTLAVAFSIAWVYLFCFCIGLFYAIFTGIFTGFFGGHEGPGHAEAGGVDAGADLDVGGADVDVGGHVEVGGHGDSGGHADIGGPADVSGHGDIGGHDADLGGHELDLSGHDAAVEAAEAVDQGHVHFSPLSPIVVAMFLTAFGAAGLITTNALKMGAWTSAPISMAAGLGVAVLTFALFYKLVQATQASSEASVAALVGEMAEVITPVPRDGLGEIAYVARGSRYTAPARSASGMTIPANTPVVIQRIVGNTFYVAPKG